MEIQFIAFRWSISSLKLKLWLALPWFSECLAFWINLGFWTHIHPPLPLGSDSQPNPTRAQRVSLRPETMNRFSISYFALLHYQALSCLVEHMIPPVECKLLPKIITNLSRKIGTVTLHISAECLFSKHPDFIGSKSDLFEHRGILWLGQGTAYLPHLCHF